MGWNSWFVKVLNSWALDSCLGVDFLLEGVGMEFKVLNVYGSYVACTPFWETLLKNNLLKVENLILGGNLNFSLGEGKVCYPQFWSL
jgi:hypothetical protein